VNSFVLLIALAVPVAAAAAGGAGSGVPPWAAGDRRAAAAAAAIGDSAALRHRWALVLSGGLARGLAHIGVLRALEEQGLRPDLVVGTSIGGLVGALWASGRSSREIQRIFHQVDVQTLFEPHPSGFEWRLTVTPRPWLSLVGTAPVVRLPVALLDDTYLCDLLVRHLLHAEALAQGDFDRLPIPWRSVATDIATLAPVVHSKGSVALAVRSSLSIPVVFPAVTVEGHLLIDGGLSSHLPVRAARAESVDHVLAVDVALPLALMTDATSGLRIGLALAEQISRRERTEALTADDHMIWLTMPGVSRADFRPVDRIVEIGYRESREQIARLARAWDLPRAATDSGGLPATAADASRLLPPLQSVSWVDRGGRSARRSAAARRLFGALPPGRLAPERLLAGLGRVYRGDLPQRLAALRDPGRLDPPHLPGA
jgi:NTE family protein